MKDEEEFRTGIFSCGEKDYTFALKNFKFLIMDPSKESINFLPNRESSSLFSDEQGAIYGSTYDAHSIAIYAPNFKCNIDGYRILRTDNYLIRQANICPHPQDVFLSFNTIEFYDGTLSKVFSPKALSVKAETKDETILKTSDDSIDFSFMYNGSLCEVSVYSSISRSYSASIKSIENSTICLSMHFVTPQRMSDVFTHYHNIRQLLSFMVFRKNITFDKVCLCNLSDDIPPKRTNEWRFYAKDKGSETRKSTINCITFSDISACLSNLVTLLYSNVDKKPSYLLDFIPNEDADVGRFSDEIIKSICSSLECEISFSKIPDSEEAIRIKALSKKVKDFIKKYYSENPPFSNKTKSKISSNIQYWGMATADQVCYLYNQYKDAIKSIPPHIVLSEDDIADFIKFRNDITHGSYRTGNMQISKSCYALEALVYCRILSRAGLDNVAIQELCIHKLMR